MCESAHNDGCFAFQLFGYLYLQAPMLEGHSDLLVPPEGHSLHCLAFGVVSVLNILNPSLPGMTLSTKTDMIMQSHIATLMRADSAFVSTSWGSTCWSPVYSHLCNSATYECAVSYKTKTIAASLPVYLRQNAEQCRPACNQRTPMRLTWQRHMSMV